MPSKIIRIPQMANPTINEVLTEFLVEQKSRLKPRTFKEYAEVINLLEDQLNMYAYEGLSDEERALFDHYFNAEGEEHKEFCQLFGPEKIPDNLGSFLGFFMIRKVMAGAELKRAAGTVAKKLAAWLSEKGYITEEAAREGVSMGAIAARELPKAEQAAQILLEVSEALSIEIPDFDDDEYMEFDHYTIAEIKSDNIWLEVFEEGEEKKLGPIPVPKKVSELLKEGWEISCALGYIRGKWRIVEMGNVYPL